MFIPIQDFWKDGTDGWTAYGGIENLDKTPKYGFEVPTIYTQSIEATWSIKKEDNVEGHLYNYIFHK
uniref:Trimethylamine-N-oxide reductase n=1 Tax=Caenorhabditis tropicalis TaxID=1561998 RepID=A0A1I7U1I8_9PELO